MNALPIEPILLHSAIEHEDLATLLRLIESGAYLDAIVRDHLDPFGHSFDSTALEFAASKGQDAAIRTTTAGFDPGCVKTLCLK